jgi:hypothetical protein
MGELAKLGKLRPGFHPFWGLTALRILWYNIENVQKIAIISLEYADFSPLLGGFTMDCALWYNVDFNKIMLPPPPPQIAIISQGTTSRQYPPLGGT